MSTCGSPFEPLHVNKVCPGLGWQQREPKCCPGSALSLLVLTPKFSGTAAALGKGFSNTSLPRLPKADPPRASLLQLNRTSPTSKPFSQHRSHLFSGKPSALRTSSLSHRHEGLPSWEPRAAAARHPLTRNAESTVRISKAKQSSSSAGHPRQLWEEPAIGTQH